MSYLPKKAVIDGIRTRKRVRNGSETTIYDAYLGYDPFSGKQRRMQNADLDKLKAEIDKFYVAHKAGGDAAVRLKAHEALDAREALDLLAQRGKAVSLTEVVRNWLGGSGATPACDKTLGDAYDGFMASLVGKSPDYLKTLRSHIGSFISEFGRDTQLASVTAQAVVRNLKERILDKDNEKTWKTYNNHLGDIKTFFGWCAKSEQGFIGVSPIADVKKIVLRYHDPEYVKAEDIGRLFAALVGHKDESPSDLADAILSFFCGMRQCEIDRVREGPGAVEINLDEGFVIVKKGKGYTRGIRKRSFTLSEQAKAWMHSFDFMAAVAVSNKQFRRHLVERAKEAKVKLPKNAGRHTFITMYAAAYHDQSKLTSIVGNTEGVRANSYDGVEVEANGRAYFGIMP
jgi:hypothetical protein